MTTLLLHLWGVLHRSRNDGASDDWAWRKKKTYDSEQTAVATENSIDIVYRQAKRGSSGLWRRRARVHWHNNSSDGVEKLIKNLNANDTVMLALETSKAVHEKD